MTWLVWNVLYCVLVFAIPAKRTYKGKFLTMPIRRRVRFFSLAHRRHIDFRGMILRIVQVSATFFFYLLPISGTTANTLGWVGSCSFFLDDWLTGDDETWNRYKDAVRNKVRWLMELPAASEPDVA